ncbi:hypothetical protein BASA61_001952 [Batrachochytrium salamandrivorans]|nr:hypothetical protein BASA61_001952 [Batrachochytrium salamandrivorans]
MSHQAARVLLRTEPEQQASVTARFQKHQAATRSQILPPAALPDIENAHKCRILILQMPRTMPFKEVRDILRPFCTTNCIWDMCWLDSTRLQIIIDDHEVMRLRGSAFQLGEVAVQHAAKLAENIFRPTPHGAALPRVKKRPSQVGVTGVQPEKEKSTNQLTPCVSDDPTSSEEHWCDMDESNPEPNLDGPHDPSEDLGSLECLLLGHHSPPLPSSHEPSLCSKTHEVEHPCCEGQFPLSQTPLKSPIKPPSNSRRIISWNINGLVSKRNDLREHIAEVKPLLLMLQETNLDTNAFRFTAPKYSFIQHPASGPGKRGIALGFLAVLPAREIEGVPGTLILAKVPGLTEQQVWTVGSIYLGKNDRQATLKLVERALELATRDHNRPIIIGGDWNAPSCYSPAQSL